MENPVFDNVLFYRCTLRHLFFCLWADVPHFCYRDDLFWSAEAECIVRDIGSFRPCVYRLAAFAFILHKVHFLQGRQYLANGMFIVKFFLQISVYDKCYETCYKVGEDLILTAQVNGACLKVRLHDAEAFLNLPPSLVRLNDAVCAVIKVREYCIEGIVLFFVCNNGNIDNIRLSNYCVEWSVFLWSSILRVLWILVKEKQYFPIYRICSDNNFWKGRISWLLQARWLDIRILV